MRRSPPTLTNALEGLVTGRTAILVTGMHRSGTSALARTLSLMGAALPDELVPPNPGNPDGHWEPQGMVDLNDRMLADAGSDLYSMVDVDSEWFETPNARRFTVRSADADRAIVAQRTADRSQGSADRPFLAYLDPSPRQQRIPCRSRFTAAQAFRGCRIVAPEASRGLSLRCLDGAARRSRMVAVHDGGSPRVTRT